jgi:hypothetical protein
MFGNSMVMALVLGNFFIGCLSIASASLGWIKNRMFGLAGIVLSAVGVILIGVSLWVSVEQGAHTAEAKPIDAAAIRQLIDDNDAKTVASLKESNEQLADRLQQSLKQLQDNQDRVFSDIQSHVLAIRTALADRSASVPQPRTDAESSNPAPKRKAKAR